MFAGKLYNCNGNYHQANKLIAHTFFHKHWSLSVNKLIVKKGVKLFLLMEG
jgi:hypothetical protein